MTFDPNNPQAEQAAATQEEVAGNEVTTTQDSEEGKDAEAEGE